jgi:GNAT superfamily N-acetyltransferase
MAATDHPPQRRNINLDEVRIAPFDKSTRRAGFACGIESIDNFLKHSAEPQHRRFHCRVYYAISAGELIGVYALSAASRDSQTISADAAKRFAAIRLAPCLYLNMLGVITDCQDRGVGKKLMVHAMETTLKVAELVGIYALILQALNEEVGRRYRKWGFDYFLGEENKSQPHMFIPLGTIRQACNANKKQQEAKARSTAPGPPPGAA